MTFSPSLAGNNEGRRGGEVREVVGGLHDAAHRLPSPHQPRCFGGGRAGLCAAAMLVVK